MGTASHGSLENEIMNAVWTIEENSENSDNLNISVADITEFINRNGSSSKAYTTVKTVMDRLSDKGYLERIKYGKKFFYTSTSSRSERARNAIRTLAGQYFNNDMQSFLKALEKECLKN